MQMASANPERQSDAAFENLKAQIVSCQLPPGSRFSEAALSLQQGLARAATRAALIRLTQLGLVQPLARHGYTVTPITLHSIRDLFELRLMIEPKAAALAVGRVDVARLRALDQAPHRAHSAEDRLRFVAANRAFHGAIAAATGNARLIALLDGLADEAERLAHIGLFGPGAQPHDREAAHDGHAQLLAAFAAADVGAVQAAATEHVLHSRALAMARLQDGAINVPLA
jgi:DNA-binding GntR family transcriptional regulator